MVAGRAGVALGVRASGRCGRAGVLAVGRFWACGCGWRLDVPGWRSVGRLCLCLCVCVSVCVLVVRMLGRETYWFSRASVVQKSCPQLEQSFAEPGVSHAPGRTPYSRRNLALL